MAPNQGKRNAIALMTAVNFADMKISGNVVETLVAFSIGSGIGLTIHDPIRSIGGVLHFMLPDSSLANGVNPIKVPFMFADTGVPSFLEALDAQGTQLDRMKVVIAGGAQVLDQAGIFNIGKKNYLALKNILKRYGLRIHYESIGGTSRRTLSLALKSGCSSIKIFGQGEQKV
jgi:chemotaxis protein CheD